MNALNGSQSVIYRRLVLEMTGKPWSAALGHEYISMRCKSDSKQHAAAAWSANNVKMLVHALAELFAQQVNKFSPVDFVRVEAMSPDVWTGKVKTRTSRQAQ
jgi:hypothetical protein